jgi:hypothetical protein
MSAWRQAGWGQRQNQQFERWNKPIKPACGPAGGRMLDVNIAAGNGDAGTREVKPKDWASSERLGAILGKARTRASVPIAGRAFQSGSRQSAR